MSSSATVLATSWWLTGAASERAQAAGIRTLVLDGLTSDRLGAAIEAALATYVYLVCEVRGYDRFTDHAAATGPPMEGDSILESRHGHGLPAVNNFVWEQWVSRRLGDEPGERVLFLRLPPGFRFESNARPVDRGLVIVTLWIEAYVGTLSGGATHVRLRNAITDEVEKARIEASFPSGRVSLSLSALGTKDALTKYLESRQAQHLVTHTVRVPRIVSDRLYWPLSKDALGRIRALRGEGKEVTFAEVEGHDLSRAWEAIISQDDA